MKTEKTGEYMVLLDSPVRKVELDLFWDYQGSFRLCLESLDLQNKVCLSGDHDFRRP